MSGLALVAVARSYLFLYDSANINPMIWLVGRKIINVSHRMRRKTISQLFGKVHSSPRAGERIKGAYAYSPMIGMNFIASPGIKGEDRIRFPLTYNQSNFTSELHSGFDFTIIISL